MIVSTTNVPPARPTPLPSVTPEAAGFDPARLAAAMALAQSFETPWPIDLRAKIEGGFFEPPPHNRIIGPTAPRGAPNALLLRCGRWVASFGDTARVDMTFSVAKSYLSLLTGLALGDGLIGSVDDPVRDTVDDGGFEGRNSGITWRHLLQQTSEWEGTLFEKPDTIDRNRVLGIDNTVRPPRDTTRKLGPPGSFWEYNDVRVNRLGLSLLRLFERPLPEVFADRIMAPIGASSEWRWEGYENSDVEVDGRMMTSVPGGGHWGGGVFIHAEDQARIALLAAQDGVWRGTRILPEGWMAQSLAPSPHNSDYGYLWWLNTNRTRTPAASARAFFALGTGGNISLVEPEDELVLILRWVDPARLNDVVAAVKRAMNG